VVPREPGNEMDVIGHYDEDKQLHSSCRLKETKTVDQNLFGLIFNEKMQMIDGGCSNEIQIIGIEVRSNGHIMFPPSSRS
jgi:hypothetical protein